MPGLLCLSLARRSEHDPFFRQAGGVLILMQFLRCAFARLTFSEFTKVIARETAAW